MDENIRSSISEFLIFLFQNKIDFKNIKIINNEIYLSKKVICSLLNIHNDIDLIIEQILEEYHLSFDITRISIEDISFYSIDMIILICYTIKTNKTIQFRHWSNKIIENCIKKGYAIDDERMMNEKIFNKNFFNNLKFEFDLIKKSKRDFYQKITDMYATSFGYDGFSDFTRRLYIDVINQRNDDDKDKKDRMVDKLLEYAYKKINNQIPMTMNDWNNIIRNYSLFYNKSIKLDDYITDYEKMFI